MEREPAAQRRPAACQGPPLCTCPPLALRAMRALVSSATPPHVELADVPDPQPLPHQALVSVRAISLNGGETRRLATLEPGAVTGWDLAGVVVHAAADGSGPP